jgi:CheY-like chemotaxis protein
MANILLIDDDPQVRRTLVRMLSGTHTLIEAADGAEGLAAFRRNPTDLVITDIVMPNREGIETIRELRRLAPQVKILAISGGSHSQMHSNYLSVAGKLGADDTLPKPVLAAQLRQCVDRLLHAASTDSCAP